MNKYIEYIKIIFRPLIYSLRTIRRLSLSLVYPSKITDPKQIPIIINNRNRLEYLRQLIAALELRGCNNIFIIDNNSSFPPLLNYYDNCKYPVIRLDKNMGHLSMWETDIYKRFIKDYYVYTDSDIVPVEECPVDFMNYFWQTLQQRPLVQKVGFSLKINDLPDSFAQKESVVKWESQFYKKEIDGRFFEGFIDTTFALYRPFMRAGLGALMYRCASPYQAYHKPWYVDSSNLSEEELYYINHATTSTHWTKLGRNN